MAIQISGNTVIDDSRNYLQVANIEFSDSTVQSVYIDGLTSAGPSVYDQFEEIETVINPNLDGNTDQDYFGEGIAISGKYMAISSSISNARNPNMDGATNKGIVHVYDTKTFQLLYTLTNPDNDGTSHDYFGGRFFANASDDQRASIAADGNYLVVGAPGEDSGGITNIGYVYVYDIRTGTLLHSIVPPTVDSPKLFGASVDISGGVIAVGMPNADVDSTFEGLVYLYQINSSTPNSDLERLGQINNPSLVPDYDKFGYSVAIDGDRIVVGAPYDTSDSTTNGKAHIFNAFSGTLISTIDNPDSTASDTDQRFGVSVQIRGDIVAIGSTKTDAPGNADAGGIYVYDISVSTSSTRFEVYGTVSDRMGQHAFQITEDYLVAPRPRFSASGVTLSGKISIYNIETGDLVGEILNPGASTNTSTRFGYGCCARGSLLVAGSNRQVHGGQVDTTHVFALNPISNSKYFDKFELINGSNTDGLKELLDTYSLNTYDKTFTLFKNPVAQAGGEVGSSVSVWNDRVAIGAVGYDGGLGGAFGIHAGRVYICDFYSGEVIKILESPHESEVSNSSVENFGWRVEMNDKWLVVYAPTAYSSYNAQTSGKAYLYDANDYHLICELRPNLDGDGDNIESGDGSSDPRWSFALDGDLLAIGIEGYRPSVNAVDNNAGAVFMFDLRETYDLTNSPNNWVTGGTGNINIPSLYSYRKYDNPNNYGTNQDDYFGHSVALKGSILAVGVPRENTSAGVVYVYDTTVFPLGNTTGLIYSIDNPNANTTFTSDSFGASVALDSGKLIVGAPGEESSGALGAVDHSTGIIYIFDANTGNQLNTVRGATNSQYEQFGTAISSNNGYVIAAAYSVLPNPQRVYIIDISTAQIIHYVENPNLESIASAEDMFGVGKYGNGSLSLHNGNLAVGAPLEDISQSASGSVYLFPIFKKTKLDRLVEMVY